MLNDDYNTLVSMMQVGTDMVPTPVQIAIRIGDCSHSAGVARTDHARHPSESVARFQPAIHIKARAIVLPASNRISRPVRSEASAGRLPECPQARSGVNCRRAGVQLLGWQAPRARARRK